MDPQLQQLVLQLSEAAVRNTASVVADRVGIALRAGKNEKAIAQLEAIINDLVDDKNELVRIERSCAEQMVAKQLVGHRRKAALQLQRRRQRPGFNLQRRTPTVYYVGTRVA